MLARSSIPAILTLAIAVACTRSVTILDGGPAPDAPIDLPPIAIVADRTARVGERVELSGASSRDPEGAPLTFSWSLRHRPEGSTATLAGSGDRAQLWPDTTGVFAIDLVVRDRRSASPPATALVLVGDEGAALPIARAGADVSVRLGRVVALDGSASTSASGGRLRFEWELVMQPSGGAATLLDPDIATPTLTPTVAGEHVISLVVHDGPIASMPDVVRVEVMERMVIDDSVARGELDSGEVYLAGTLSEGACGRGAIAHPGRPDVAAVGFDCYFNDGGAMLTPDGTLLYFSHSDVLLREFSCDGCPTWSGSDPYPSDPRVNDAVLPTPPCNPDDLRMRLRSFLVGPDGSRIHSCGGAWYRATGEEILGDVTVHAVGWDEHLLLEDGVLDLGTGATAPLVGLPSCVVRAVRAGATEGFVIALGCSSTTELWTVAHDGIATMEGTYPEPPIGYRLEHEHALETGGALVQFARGPITFEDAIIRRTIDGVSELVYTEEMTPRPRVKIHGSALVTGP